MIVTELGTLHTAAPLTYGRTPLPHPTDTRTVTTTTTTHVAHDTHYETVPHPILITMRRPTFCQKQSYI